MSHPLPFMKASGAGVGPPAKKGKDKPDLEEAIEESEEEEVLADPTVEADDEELDLKKDKYVQAPKKKKAAAGGKKGKKKDDDDSEEEVQPAKGKGRKGKGKK
jgi:replication factor C subunit 1